MGAILAPVGELMYYCLSPKMITNIDVCCLTSGRVAGLGRKIWIEAVAHSERTDGD